MKLIFSLCLMGYFPVDYTCAIKTPRPFDAAVSAPMFVFISLSDKYNNPTGQLFSVSFSVIKVSNYSLVFIYPVNQRFPDFFFLAPIF